MEPTEEYAEYPREKPRLNSAGRKLDRTAWLVFTAFAVVTQSQVYFGLDGYVSGFLVTSIFPAMLALLLWRPTVLAMALFAIIGTLYAILLFVVCDMATSTPLLHALHPWAFLLLLYGVARAVVAGMLKTYI